MVFLLSESSIFLQDSILDFVFAFLYTRLCLYEYKEHLQAEELNATGVLLSAQKAVF